jgi:hypothetical protein
MRPVPPRQRGVRSSLLVWRRRRRGLRRTRSHALYPSSNHSRPRRRDRRPRGRSRWLRPRHHRAALFRLSCPRPPRRPSLNRQLPPRSHCRHARALQCLPVRRPQRVRVRAFLSRCRSPNRLRHQLLCDPLQPKSPPPRPLPSRRRQRFRRARRHLSSPHEFYRRRSRLFHLRLCPSRLRSLPTRSSPRANYRWPLR